MGQTNLQTKTKFVWLIIALGLAMQLQLGAVLSRSLASSGDRRAAEEDDSARTAVARVDYSASSSSRTAAMASGDHYCDRVVHLDGADPGGVNKLRRELASDEDPRCYERHFSDFATHFKNRLNSVKNHLNLHIPKAGGSSLCKFAQSTKMETPPGNCFHRVHFIPLWCCYKWKDRKGFPKNITCDIFDRNLKEFTMNENYLDYPLCMNTRLYSILLRGPVERAMSQERHYMKFIEGDRRRGTYLNYTAIAGRLDVIRSNYMTWSLTSGLVASEKRLQFVPKRRDLMAARDTLSRMDFLLQITPPRDRHKLADAYETKCLPTMLKMMGFGNATMNKTNAGEGRRIPLEFNASQYHRWNTLDTQLYQYATKLAKLDCEFFLRVEEGEGRIEEIEGNPS